MVPGTIRVVGWRISRIRGSLFHGERGSCDSTPRGAFWIGENNERERVMRYIFGLFAALFLAGTAGAQVQIQINIGSQPAWGPEGYDYAEYYYLPDLDIYYYVPGHQFIYLQGQHWVRASSLPPRYHKVDLYHAYKVVVNEREPYLRHQFYREKYQMYRGRHDQRPIRESHDSRYFVNKKHPEHKSGVSQAHGRQGNNGNGKGNGRGNGKGNRGNGRRK